MSKYFMWTTLNRLEDEQLFFEKLKFTPNLKFIDKNNEILEFTPSDSQKYKVKIKKMSLDLKQDDGYDAMRKKLAKILEYAHCNAEKIGNEKGQEHEKEDGAAINSLYSLLTKWHYDEIDNISILSCASDILYKLLIGHYYVNANKRTALLATIQFLQSFGFFVKFNPLKYSSNDWEPKLIKIIDIHEKESMTEIEQLNEIKEWIKSHLLISYQWYNL